MQIIDLSFADLYTMLSKPTVNLFAAQMFPVSPSPYLNNDIQPIRTFRHCV